MNIINLTYFIIRRPDLPDLLHTERTHEDGTLVLAWHSEAVFDIPSDQLVEPELTFYILFQPNHNLQTRIFFRIAEIPEAPKVSLPHPATTH